LIGTFSGALAEIPGLAALLGDAVIHLRSVKQIQSAGVRAIVGWGQRPSTRRPRAVAAKLGLPFIALEDGFLRSYGTGGTHPALSLVVDTQGIYYDATQPSDLESLLASDVDLLSGPGADHARARALILKERLSKYNFAPNLLDLPVACPLPPLRGTLSHVWEKGTDCASLSPLPRVGEGSGERASLQDAARPRVLVVDQTQGDVSIRCGLACESTFAAMLDAARRENPGACIYVKTHPEVSNGAKRGHYTDLQADAHTVLLRAAINPLSLLAHVDRVYVVTSHMGFEALLAGVPVTCFGMPWYAGWGVTDDRVQCPRRGKPRTVAELFAAAYLHYTRYLNPYTHGIGNIFDVIDWLVRQRRMAARLTGRSIAVGYRRWKAENVHPFLALDPHHVHFVGNAHDASEHHPGAQDRLIVWGAEPAQDVKDLANRSGATLLRMEDGFIRSVGLGSDFIAPQSLVLDGAGMYFDPRQPSDLENLLNTQVFTDADCARAARLRALIVEHAITKYNIEPHAPPAWRQTQRHTILVPGQVEDDASIRYGCEDVQTNLALLRAVRVARPDAFVVYKPHPDVVAGNRAGKVHHDAARQYADAIETRSSVLSCIDACDEVHTMTSLTGFDALLRHKAVTVYGRPFYAGWGLTEDRLPLPRRSRALSLDELVAGTLLYYPVYWDWTLKGFTTCEATILAIVRRRDALLAGCAPSGVRMNAAQRRWHKVKRWARAGFMVKR